MPQHAHLTISAKTCVVGTTAALRLQVAEAAVQAGVPATAAAAAVDLGTDTAAATRRPRTKWKARQAAAGKRLKGIYSLRKHASLAHECQMLWRTGAFPQQTFGYQVYGVPPSELLALRRQAA